MEELIFNAKSIRYQKDEDTSGGNNRKRASSSGFQFTRKERTISEARRKELEKLYANVVVNDFGDDYHLSEEEKERKSRFYKVFIPLQKCKRKYRKIDEFIKVYRMNLAALKVVAENNGVYSSEKFIRMVLKKDIKVYGLNFPKYIGKDKKELNWKYITEFIADPDRDISELIDNDIDIFDDGLTEEEKNIQLFGDSWKSIVYDIEHEDELKPVKCIDIELNEEDREQYAVYVSEEETSKFVKKLPVVIKTVQRMEKEARRNKNRDYRLNSFVYNMTEDDFDKIAEIDNSRGYISSSDIPQFEGNIMNSDDRRKYLRKLEEFERTQIKVNYHGKMRTREEIDEIEMKDLLEASGWNVRKLYNNKDKEKKLKKALKRDKKREEQLKKELIAVQDRYKSRSKEVEFDAKKKKKKKKNKDEESD